MCTDDPPLWSALLSPSARAAALRENRRHCPNCQEDTLSFRNCRHPFVNASGCLNPELGLICDDDAYRRWQARMTSYRRGGKSRARSKKHCRYRSVHTRGYHQDQGRGNSSSGHPGNTYVSGHHGGVPPSPASAAPAATLGVRLGAAHNAGGNPNARHPGTFRTGK